VDQVVAEIDPALALAHDDRWRAGLEGKTRAFSGDLRRGLAKTLALLGIHGDGVAAAHGGTGKDSASNLVGRLLKAANADDSGRLWASLSSLLPLLAEAGPDAFVDAVRAGLTGETPLLLQMFTDQGDAGFLAPSSPHTGLLWALETLAWSPSYFGATVDLLARLDEVDPGGKMGNRPFKSLGAIFCPWHPETTASPDARLAALDGLRKRHPRCAWQLTMSMLPEFQGTHLPTHAPQIRDWKPTRMALTTVEYFGFVGELVGRALEDATNAERWSALIEHLPDLPPDDRARVVDDLERRASEGSMPENDRATLWQSLQTQIGRHREYETADWALPSEAVDRLAEVAEGLAPSDSFSRTLWLFSDHAPHIGGARRGSNRTDYEAELTDLRREAVSAIHSEGGLDSVLHLANVSVVAWTVGVALADALGEVVQRATLDLLAVPEASSELELAHAYFARRFTADGWTWLRDLLAADANLTNLQRARLLLATHDFPAAWELADAQGAGVAETFWRFFSPYGLGQDFGDLEFVANRLIGAGRLGAALWLLEVYAKRQGSGEEHLYLLMATALEGLLIADAADSDVRALSQHDFHEIFELLEQHRDSVGEDRLASLEWAFLPALGFEPTVPSLHVRMAEDPAFFLEIVSTVYRARSGEEENEESLSEEDAEKRRRRATNGYHLLSSWARPPGLGDDGFLDPSRLEEWVGEARRLLQEADRLEVGEVHLGQVLASAPSRDGEAWPPESVRDLLEDLQSEEIESGLRTELLNGRGVTSRGLEDGGALERDLFDKYRQDADLFADRWPRTARILRSIAENYERDARRNEELAERFRRGLER